jgi:hypothetical protein
MEVHEHPILRARKSECLRPKLIHKDFKQLNIILHGVILTGKRTSISYNLKETKTAYYPQILTIRPTQYGITPMVYFIGAYFFKIRFWR